MYYNIKQRDWKTNIGVTFYKLNKRPSNTPNQISRHLNRQMNNCWDTSRLILYFLSDILKIDDHPYSIFPSYTACRNYPSIYMYHLQEFACTRLHVLTDMASKFKTNIHTKTILSSN